MIFSGETTVCAKFGGWLFVFLFVSAGLVLQGQTTAKYVPSDAFFVLTTNLQNLDKKMNLDDLQQLDIYRELVKNYSKRGRNESERAYFGEMLRTPSALGFDVLETSSFFVCREGAATFLTFASKMGDRTIYESHLQQLKGEDYTSNLQQKDGYALWMNGEETYAWNDEIIINIWQIDLPGTNGYEDTGYEEFGGEWEEEDSIFEDETEEEETEFSEPSMEEDTEWQAIEDEYNSQLQEKKEAAEKWAAKIIHRSFLQPLSATANFQAAAPQSFDFHLWMDYSYLLEYFNPQRSMGMMSMDNEFQKAMAMMQSFMEIFYAGTYLSMGMNFENGRIAIQSEMFFNEEMRSLYQGIYDVKLNKNFLRYVKGDGQLFGYFYMNYNLKKAIDEGKNLVYKLLDATPAYGDLAADAVKILGIFVDEDAIANLLKGDMMLAVSGMQTIPVTSKTYDMDEEFNMIEKDTTVLKSMPIVTMLLSYGSEKDIMKFVNLGLHAEVLKPQGRYYSITVPGAGVELYLALRKGTLILTNDRELVQNHLDTGYPRSQRLSKKHRKMLCDNASAIYWDIPNTLHEVAGGETGAALGIEPYVNMITQEFESIDIRASRKVDNSIKGVMNFNFVNKNSNSLQVLFHFLNDLFLDVMGGAKT